MVLVVSALAAAARSYYRPYQAQILPIGIAVKMGVWTDLYRNATTHSKVPSATVLAPSVSTPALFAPRASSKLPQVAHSVTPARETSHNASISLPTVSSIQSPTKMFVWSVLPVTLVSSALR